MGNYLNESQNEEPKYTIYADFFSEKINVTDDELEEDRRNKKREDNEASSSRERSGENEYATLRAKNSTIFSDYFGCGASNDYKREAEREIKREPEDDKIYSSERNEEEEEEEIVPFPINKNYVLKLFEGDLIQKKHKIKLKKPGFYGIFVENHNSLKWDIIYFGLAKVQVQLQYKLHVRNKHMEEIEKRNLDTDLNESVDLEDYLDELKRTRARKIRAQKEKQKKKEENIEEQINEACKFNLEQNIFDLDIDKKNRNEKKKKNKNKLQISEDDDEVEYYDEDYYDENKISNDGKKYEFEDEINEFLENKLKAKNTNYYDNLELKTKHRNIPFESDDDAGEEYTCSFKLENCLRVSAKKNRFTYMYNEEPNTILEIDVSSYMAMGMSVSCKYGVLYCGKYHTIPKSPNAAFTRPVSILTLDGGGVLSISSLQILSRLEVEVRKQLGNDDVNLIDCFDMICGTSAGGLISLGLLRELSVQDMVRIWPSTIKQIFYGRRTLISGLLFGGYNVNRAKAVLLENMGNKFMSSFKKTYCFVATTDVKHKPFRLFLFRNYSHKHKPVSGEPYPGINKVPLWVAGWATAAAPTYIKGASGDDINQMGLNIKPEVHLIDGALKANNPTLIALEECARLSNKCLATFIKEDLDTVVSVGTGQFPTQLTQADPKQPTVSTLEILLSAAHLLTRANQTHREILQWLGERENVYFRLNTPNIGDIELDSHRPADFDLIVKATHEYLFDEKYYDIKRLAAKLANNYIRSRYL